MNDLNIISESLYQLLITINRQVLNPHEMMKTFPVPPSHARVLFYLHHSGVSSISEIATNLGISKPNMTPIIDNLLKRDLVVRYTDTSDRRILRIKLTDKAYELFAQKKELIKEMLINKISNLSDEDLTELDDSIVKTAKIISKLKEEKDTKKGVSK